jgi:hypothetical protein
MFVCRLIKLLELKYKKMPESVKESVKITKMPKNAGMPLE